MPAKKPTPNGSTETKARKPAAPRTKKTAVAAAPPTQEEIANLAGRYWMDRGSPVGSPEVDWLRAEQELAGAGA